MSCARWFTRSHSEREKVAKAHGDDKINTNANHCQAQYKNKFLKRAIARRIFHREMISLALINVASSSSSITK